MISLSEVVQKQKNDDNLYKVTVLVTCYNQSGYIERSLDSILSQKTSFPFRIVVSDDGSTDGSQAILQKYRNKYPVQIEVLFHEYNQGVNANRNDAILKCDTPYVAFLDGDDYWCDDEQLERKYSFLEQNPEFIGYFTGGAYGDEPGKNDYERRNISDAFSRENALKNEYPGMYGGFFLRNIYKYMSKEDLQYYMDCPIDESSKLPIIAGMIGDIYRQNETTWVYRPPQKTNLSVREKEQFGCKEYFLSRMSMQEMIRKFWNMDMKIDYQLEELVYNAFVTMIKKPSGRNIEQYTYIRNYGYFTKKRIRRIIGDRIRAKVRK